MKNNKNKKIIIILLTIIMLLSSCTTGNIPDNVTKTDTSTNTSQETATDSQLDTKYEKIHFGETQDILLLDIEWHTPESYEEMRLEAYENIDEIPDETLEWIKYYKNIIKNGEQYLAKIVNGKDYGFASSNPYNNNENWDRSDTSQIDPDGYFIFNMYPFDWSIVYIDENGEYQGKSFTTSNEKEFYLIADDLISYCDGLLAEGKLTQEEYDYYAIKSPLDYYVRVRGLFGEDDLKNYPLKEYTFPPTPELIKDKKDFTVLFVGNSLVYAGDMPKQVNKLSEMYGITVTYDSVTPGGAILSDNMAKAVEKVQNNKYDYVIFQDGGDLPVSNPTAFLFNVETFSEEVKKSGAIPVLYNPAWVNIDKKPAKGSQASLTASYEKAAKFNGALIVNAGEAWVYAYDKHPDLKLYADEVHANNAGAYLTACMVVSTLFDLHVKDICEDNVYHGDDAIRLGQAAWEYVSYYNEYKKSPTEIVTVPNGSN